MERTQMTEPITFFIPGVPKPGGSKRGFFNPKLKRVMIVDACNNVDWKRNVTFFAGKTHEGAPLLDCPLQVEITFIMPRPKGHYRANGQLKPNAPKYHTNAPDVLKLTRSTEDAMSGVVFKDDKLIAREFTAKVYGEKPGAWVRISIIEDVYATLPQPVAEAVWDGTLFSGRECA